MNLFKNITEFFTRSSASSNRGAGTWKSNSSNPLYKSGQVDSRNKHFRPGMSSGDAAIDEIFEVSTARARKLVEDSPELSKCRAMTTALVIGPGLRAHCEAVDASGEFLDKMCEASDEAFEHWALHEADATGRETLWDMMGTSFSEMQTTGVVLWLEVMNSDPDRSSPLSYQLLEVEQIDRTKDQAKSPGRNVIRHGIEFDKFNKAIAVHLWDEHPYDQGSWAAGHWQSKRIPIRRLIINYRPNRISAHIGMTWYNSLMQTVADQDTMVQNELTARAVKALMTLFVKTDNPGCVGSALNAEDATTNRSKIEMGYPAIVEIGKDESIEVAESKHESGKDASTFVSLLLGQIAMGSHLSRHRVTGNAAEANMASIKAGHTDDERLTAPLQQHQINKVVRPIRMRHQGIAAMNGEFSAVGVSPQFYKSNRRRLTKFMIIGGGDPDFQPKDDGQAAIDRMRSGRTTPQQEIAKTGNYWRAVIRRQAQYFKELKKHGLGHPDLTSGGGGTYLPFVPLSEQPVLQEVGGGDSPKKPKESKKDA
jgi:lambda family phage portal protein